MEGLLTAIFLVGFAAIITGVIMLAGLPAGLIVAGVIAVLGIGWLLFSN